MKLLFWCVALAVAQAGAAERPELAEIKTVYLLPMTYSLDQFLGVRLTKGGVLQVVTDPNLADAVVSDVIGASLESRLNTLYGEKKKADKEKGDDKTNSMPSFAGPAGGASRSKGAVFLIDRRTRSVVWSDYVRPKNADPTEMNRVADRIASQLEKDKKGKQDK